MNSRRFPSFIEILLENPAFAATVAELWSGKSVSVDGVIGSSCALAAAAIQQAGRKTVLVLVPTAEQVDRVADDLELFTTSDDPSSVEIAAFPALDDLAEILRPASVPAMEDEDGIDPNVFALADDLFGQRLRVLKRLAANRPAMVVASLPGVLQPVPTRELLADRSQTLAVGSRLDLDAFRRFLVEGGYHATPAVELPGEFAVRGYILDLFAPDWEQPVRIELFGDEIESIRKFDITSQRSLESVEEISLTRLLPREAVGANLLDYLPETTPVILVEPRELELAGRTYLERLGNPPSLPTLSLLTVSDLMRRILTRPTASFSNLSEGLEDVHVRLPVSSVERLHGNLETVGRELDLYDSEQIFIFCPTEAEIQRLTELLADIKPAKEGRLHLVRGRLSSGFALQWRMKDTGANTVSESPNSKKRKTKPNKDQPGDYGGVPPSSPALCADNFAKPDKRSPNSPFSILHSPLKLLLLSSSELFERHDIRRPKRRQLGQVIDSFLDLKPGDFVVHVGHGIARYRGIEVLLKGQQEEEHLHLEFADSQTLYIPISKIGLVQKYVAGTKHKPKLAKIGGQLWARHKKAVQEAVFDLAGEMIELQARREAVPGTAFPPDSDWQREFDAAFPFRETNDQLLAIEAVKHDMELPRPMDRLLCGDVGFGKTEVAIRAAFKAVDAGYQVAVLVPTTILAEQHRRTFSERMREFPITVAALSRFQSKAEQTRIVEELASGKVDIVIGTHRVVSADIKFQNLGLVVIDEEQRFGVAHKERLKTFRDAVDVLTMTATPIPRTLHFSLLGIREISNLETPPEDRLAVETRVIRFNDEIIRTAVNRELNRGGQIYFVHNRVHDIDEFADRIQRIVPECRIGIGHAQMPDDELERIMKAFVDHEFDMLISTTIIESGLDIPNANTMFIDEADRYGLADLHQLRGRVGRYKHQAYCYLMLGRHQMLNSQAAKRLRAIEEYAHLGSGFHLAMRDLEIRGAGNILGTRQSGHIAAVGYEMYCQFLETAVRALKQLPPKTVVEVELDLPGLALIPMSYVADHRVKIDLYRRLTRVATPEEWADLRAEILDRFGSPPPEVERILIHSKIRVLAHAYRIRAIRLDTGLAGDSGYVVFQYVSEPLMERLKNRLEKQGRTIRFTDDRHAYVPMPPDFSRDADPDKVLALVAEILRD